MKLFYERGERVQKAGRYFDGTPDPQLGKFERFEAVPNDPDALQSLLQEERRSREQLPPGDFKAHIAALRDGLIETEARRIVWEMKRHDTPNSPNKTHFMVELSPAFMQLAATKDTDRLFSMLPYKTLLWFCRPSGTHCFRERDVFLKDTAPHNTWRFYMEQTSDRVLAYAIELTGKERGKIKGTV